jgi:hypothetical protein
MLILAILADSGLDADAQLWISSLSNLLLKILTTKGCRANPVQT